MNQSEFRKELIRNSFKSQANLSPAQLFMVSLERFELRRLGLDEKSLLPVLLSIDKIADGSLSIKRVFQLADSHQNTPFEIKTIRVVSLLNSVRRKGLAEIICKCREIPEYSDRKFLEENGVDKDVLLEMAMSHLVLAKIKLGEEDFRAIDVPEKIIKIKNKKLILITLNKHEGSNDCRRARECPMRMRCRKYFDVFSYSGFISYSCSQCPVYKLERDLRNDGYFDPIDVGSYGVAQLGF